MGREKPWGRGCQRAYFTVADPEEGPDPPPLFFDQNEATKFFFGNRALPLSQGLHDRPPPPLSQGLDDRPHFISGSG